MDKELTVKLVKAMQAGDQNAAGQLYEGCYQDIYYFILKTVKEKELAEDLTQDTFMKIMENISQLQEPEAFVGWSRQIAYHGCTAYFRKHKELLSDENEDGGTVFDTVAEENAEFIPDEALDREDLKKTILAMINSLPREQQTALLLRYYEELPVAEIAKIQGVSEGTVKSRLNYGRNAVRKSVEEYEKKNGIKLHSFAILPLLLWLFRKTKLQSGKAITVAAGGAVSGAVAAAGAATKGFWSTIGAKITAGVLAVAVAGGAIFGVTKIAEKPESGDEDGFGAGIFGGKDSDGSGGQDDLPEGMVEIWLPISTGNGARTVTYDQQGNILEMNSQYHFVYTYNDKGQLERIDEYRQDGSVDAYYTYTYDNQGNRISATCIEPDDLEKYGPSNFYWEYDSEGNLTKSICPNSTYIYTYENGRLVEKKDFWHGDHDYTTYYTYNADGLLIREDFKDLKGDLGDDYTEYTYDENNCLTAKVQRDERFILSEMYCSYENGRIVSYEKNESFLNGRFTYDEHGNIIEIRDLETDVVTFQFEYERFVVTQEQATRLQEIRKSDDMIRFWIYGSIGGVENK